MTSYELQGRGASAILEKIMELQQEIALINLHERAHVSGASLHFEPSCGYCQVHAGQIKAARIEDDKKAAVSSELERSVELGDKAGAVTVPRSWIGKRVKVVLLG